MEAFNTAVKSVGRDEKVDIYKGIGIICMMMGHIGFGGIIDHSIHAFHMPMFFFISGYLFKEKPGQSAREWLKKKAGALLIPYLVFGLMHYVIWVFMQLYKQEPIGLEPLVRLFTINTTKLPIAGALWFLTALFFTNLMFYILHKYAKNTCLQVIFCVIIVAIGHIAVKFLPFRLPLALDAAMIGLGLFYIGYILKQNMNQKLIYKLFHLPVWQGLILGAVVFLLIMVNEDINMRTGQYTYIILFWVNAVLASIVLYNAAAYLEMFFGKLKLFAWGTELLKGIGRHSIVYVCLNQIVIIVWQALLSGFEREEIAVSKIIVRLGVLVLSIVVLEILEKYLKISRMGSLNKELKQKGNGAIII